MSAITAFRTNDYIQTKPLAIVSTLACQTLNFSIFYYIGNHSYIT